jgi:predicted NBD/HSP70 family sugar kinase
VTRPTGSAKLLRSMNTTAALAHLLDSGQLTRAHLRELTGLSKPTSSEMLRLLTEAGLAVVTGRTSGGPGPNAEIYSPNPDAGYAVALSVRDTTGTDRPPLAVALCDLTGDLRDRAELPVDFAATGPVDAVERAVAEACRRAGVDRERIGQLQLGVAGSYDPATDTIHHVDVPGWGAPGVIGACRERLGTEVAVDNDANLAAVAERRHGVGAGTDSFALLWIGHGLGLAIDQGGALLRGARGGAGEIGYMPAQPGRAAPDAPVDLQDLVGGPAVVTLAAEFGLRARTPVEALAAATAPDEPAAPGADVFLRAIAERIAFGLAAVVAVLDPPLVVLAGEVAQAGGARLRDAVAAAMHEPLQTEIAITAVDDDAVLLGALDAGLTTLRESLLATLSSP